MAETTAVEKPQVPWELGVHDSHCHPTDAMASIASIASMKATTFAIMATRLEDQALVAQVARSHPPTKVIPSFGYHPWFSHLIWDDTTMSEEYEGLDETALKIRHYSRVLTPPPDDALVTQLPVPRPLSAAVAEIKQYLDEFPHALVGEIGLDRGFRLPCFSTDPPGPPGSTPARHEHGGLIQHRVSMDHQKAIFKAQLAVAGSLGRGASVHGVQCHGILFDTFREVWAGHELPRERPKDRKRRRRKAAGGGHEYLPDLAGSDLESDEDEAETDFVPKPFPPRICLHSFSAPLETLKQYLSPLTPTKLLPSTMFFSFSSTVNARPKKGHLSKIGDTIKAVPDESLLIESDLHTAGEEMDEALEAALLLVNELKGWGMEHGVRQLDANWKRFVFGDVDAV